MTTNPTAPTPQANATPASIASIPGLDSAATQAHMNGFTFDLSKADPDITLVSASPAASDAIHRMAGLVESARAITPTVGAALLSGIGTAFAFGSPMIAALATSTTLMASLAGGPSRTPNIKSDDGLTRG